MQEVAIRMDTPALQWLIHTVILDTHTHTHTHLEKQQQQHSAWSGQSSLTGHHLRQHVSPSLTEEVTVCSVSKALFWLRGSKVLRRKLTEAVAAPWVSVSVNLKTFVWKPMGEICCWKCFRLVDRWKGHSGSHHKCMFFSQIIKIFLKKKIHPCHNQFFLPKSSGYNW